MTAVDYVLDFSLHIKPTHCFPDHDHNSGHGGMNGNGYPDSQSSDVHVGQHRDLDRDLDPITDDQLITSDLEEPTSNEIQSEDESEMEFCDTTDLYEVRVQVGFFLTALLYFCGSR